MPIFTVFAVSINFMIKDRIRHFVTFKVMEGARNLNIENTLP